MRRRILAIALVAVAMVSISGVAQATTSPLEYQYNSSTHQWKDTHCDGSQKWDVTFFQDANFVGPSTRICSATPNFCNVPLYPNGVTGCGFLDPHYALHDEATSVRWSLYGLTPCVAAYSSVSYAGEHLRMPPPYGSIANLGNYDIGNDTADAVKAVSTATCVST